MRVLLVHNFYRSSAPSGEDEVVRSEQRLLEQNGFEVVPFWRHNDDIKPGIAGMLGASLSNAWSFEASGALRKVIAGFRPHIAHFHNTFPQISPAASLVSRAAGVPVVQTLHNYRMFCANGLLTRAGVACESCVGRAPLPALVHGCYRDSRVATAGMVLGSSFHRARRTYQRFVDRYIVLTEFARQRFLAHGLPAERMVVRGNGLPFDPGVGAGAGTGGYALYVGRLTAEKGVATLIRAWRKTPGIPLRIAGDGELRAQLEREACDLPIEFLGKVTPERVYDLLRGAAMLVIPSECYEGFPRVMVEAFATGTPIVAANLGGLGELIDDESGIRFRAGNAVELAAGVTRMWRSPELRGMLGQANRRRFEQFHSPAASLTTLRDVYRQTVREYCGSADANARRSGRA